MSDKLDKVFDLLEKVYSELQDTKSELQDTKNEVKENSNRLVKLEAVLENDIKPDIKAVYQVQTDVVSKLDSHDLRLKNIEENIETLSQNLFAIVMKSERLKDKKRLSEAFSSC